jgi:hypothetical protein
VAVGRAAAITGPTHVAAGPQGVAVHADGAVHRLTADGEWLGASGQEHFGLGDMPIDLAWAADGRLVVAGQQPASAVLCDPEGWNCVALATGVLAPLARQFKLLRARDGDAWWITDAPGDALWRLDARGERLEPALVAGTLAGANGMSHDGEGHLWIADTDRRRIVEVVGPGGGPYGTAREHSAVNALTIGQRHYPMALAWGVDGHFWVAQAASFREAEADLVRYHPDDGAVSVVSLPPGAYPTDVAALGPDLLVSDMERFRLYRVSAATGAVEDFGDGAFRGRLESAQARRASLQRLGTVSLALVIAGAVLLIGAAIRLTPRERRWSQVPPALDLDAADAVPAGLKGVHWLERNPGMRWMTSGFEKLFYVLFGLLCLASYLLYAWSCGRVAALDGGLSEADRLGLLLLLICLATAAFIPMIHFAAQALRRRLGTDGERIHLEFEDGRRIVVAPERLAWNDRALLHGRHTFPMQTGRRNWIYAEGEVQDWLAPLLRPENRLNEWQTLKHQWRHRDRAFLAAVGAVAFLGLVYPLARLVTSG